MGNGQKLYSEGCVRRASLLIQGFEITADRFVLPVEGADVVLGIAWLSTLGIIVHDYKNLTMQFASNGSTVVLQGDRSLLKGPTQLQSLRRLVHNDVVLSFLTFQLEDSRFLLQPEIATDLVSLLHQYEDVSQVPGGIPPPREYDLPLLCNKALRRF